MEISTWQLKGTKHRSGEMSVSYLTHSVCSLVLPSRPSASPLDSTGSGAKIAGRGCLSVSLQPAWPFQPDFPAVARDVVCWLPRGTKGYLPGKKRSPNS